MKVLCADTNSHYQTCFERFIAQELNCKVKWIGKNKIGEIRKHPQKIAMEKFILLIDVKGRIPETLKNALQILGLEGRTLSILTTVD